MRARSRLICAVWVAATLGLTAPCAAETVSLPRKPDPARKDESYQGVTVLYDAVSDPAGHRLRATAPR